MTIAKVLRLLAAVAITAGMVSCSICQAHVYEVVEESFTAARSYDNPYMEVDLWIELYSPEGQIFRIPAFRDGGQSFKVRMIATKPGIWKWSTGTTTGDRGLDNKRHYGHVELVKSALFELPGYKQDITTDASSLVEISRQISPEGDFEVIVVEY